MNDRLANQTNFLRHQPCGLYVHIPFCDSKCGYCDFYSVALKDRATKPLVEAVVNELDVRTASLEHAITTVFVGGGTPTTLPSDELRLILQAVSKSVGQAQLDEFTVEANPATVEHDKALLLQQCCVSRVSMGAQSFFPEELATLERLHTPEDIAPSVDTLRRAGIDQINLDLIFGIPGQTMKTWSQSLHRAIDLTPDHIACYGLTYEPQTRLTAMREANRITPCDEGLEADMYLLAIDELCAAGYRQYETSNFTRPGCESQHNLIYWRNQPFIGVGPSAAGCTGNRRYKNVPDLNAYVNMMLAQHHAEVEVETLDNDALMLESILMQLRLIEGLSIEAFQHRFDLDPREHFSSVLPHLVSLGNLIVTASHIALTPQGRLVADAVIRELAFSCIPVDTPLKVLNH